MNETPAAANVAGFDIGSRSATARAPLGRRHALVNPVFRFREMRLADRIGGNHHLLSALVAWANSPMRNGGNPHLLSAFVG